MGFLFSKKPVLKVELVLDIGSKSVGGGVFDRTPEGKARLLYTAREPIVFQQKLTGENLTLAMRRSLDTVLLHLEKYGVGHLRSDREHIYEVCSVTVVVSSPWHASETRLLKLKFDKPTPITKVVIEELVNNEEKSFEKRAEGASEGGGGFEVLEQKIIEMRLNGYPTARPYDKLASELEVRVFGSIITPEIFKLIKTLVGKRFPVDRFEFHTFSLTAFASIRDLFPAVNHFLIVQIGGEVTDITIVKKDVILETVSFPVGHNEMLRSLERICQNHPHCTLEALIALNREGGAETRDQKRVVAALADMKAIWLKHFNDAIANFSEETFLPKTVFLLEDDRYAHLFEKFLKDAGSSQFTLTAEPFLVNVFDQKITRLFADSLPNVFPDPVLAMEASFSTRIAALTGD